MIEARFFAGLAGAFASLAAGCTDAGLGPPSLLDTYRILGVVAEPAEPAVGERVTLTLAAVDVRPRPVDIAWVSCRGLLRSADLSGNVQTGGRDVCPGALPIGRGPTIEFAVPEDRVVRTPDGPVAQLAGFACAGGRIEPPTEGEPLPSCRGDGAVSWIFVRQLPVRDPASSNPPNHNPRIAEVRLRQGEREVTLAPDAVTLVPACADATDGSECPEAVFEVRATPESRETFVAPSRDGDARARPEPLVARFLIEGGVLGTELVASDPREPVPRFENLWRVPETRGEVQMAVWVSDGRGGMDWTVRRLRLR